MKIEGRLLDTVLLGDCMDVLQSLPDESVQLIVSSPPYNLGKEYESRRALAIYLDEQAKVLHECERVLADGGSLVWQVGAYAEDGMLIPLDIRYFPILENLGLRPRNRIVWARTHGLHARRKFSARHETILWFTKGQDYTFNLDAIRVPQKYQNKTAWRGDRKGELTCHPDGKNPGDIWVFRNVKHNHEEQTIHPCQFPEDLVARLVLALTNVGDVVLDPYMGTGTTAVVARDCNRHFVGAELEPVYHAVALQRLAGTPDEDGIFPNLKTLRDYAAKTGTDPSLYRFAMQRGKRATPQTLAKINSEDYHREQLIERLTYEEDVFSSHLRDEKPPPLPANAKRRPAAKSSQEELFD